MYGWNGLISSGTKTDGFLQILSLVKLIHKAMTIPTNLV